MKNKNVLITGAATRVGRAIAIHFAEKGWNVALHYFRSSSKAKELKKIIGQQFAKQASKKTFSNIINIIDQRIFNLTPYFMSYTISKTGLQTLTKTMAMRLGPNIKVNGIAPGPTIKSKRQTNTHFKNQIKSTLLKKTVRLQDICDTVDFLINNDSITGQIIAVDSGQNLSRNKKNEKE